MKLIKFLFWFCLVFIIAYLITDLKMGGKTIKQYIDQVIAGTVVGDYKDKGIEWITLHLQRFGVSRATGEALPSQDNPFVEDISDHDAANLKKLIEKNN